MVFLHMMIMLVLLDCNCRDRAAGLEMLCSNGFYFMLYVMVLRQFTFKGSRVDLQYV